MNPGSLTCGSREADEAADWAAGGPEPAGGRMQMWRDLDLGRDSHRGGFYPKLLTGGAQGADVAASVANHACTPTMPLASLVWWSPQRHGVDAVVVGSPW
jgi:hypothetical protein